MGKILVANGNKITSEQIKCRRGFDAALNSSDKLKGGKKGALGGKDLPEG